MALVFTDDVNRPDASDLGQNYAMPYGSGFALFTIASKAATPGNISIDNYAILTGAVLNADQWCEITIGSVGSANALNHGTGPCVRLSYSAASPTFPFGYVWTTNDVGNYLALKNASGDTVLKNNDPTTFANGDRAMLAIQGSTLYCLKNRVLLFTAVDATLSAGQPGLFYSSTATSLGTLSKIQCGDFLPYSPPSNDAVFLADQLIASLNSAPIIGPAAWAELITRRVAA